MSKCFTKVEVELPSFKIFNKVGIEPFLSEFFKELKVELPSFKIEFFNELMVEFHSFKKFNEVRIKPLLSDFFMSSRSSYYICFKFLDKVRIQLPFKILTRSRSSPFPSNFE